MNYSTENLLLFLVIGIVAGFIAGKIMKGAGFGLAGDLIVGALILLYIVRQVKTSR